jgi:hypothetical protein
LKKRTKKLSLLGRTRCGNAYARLAKVFASFFKKKRFLSCRKARFAAARLGQLAAP